MSDHSHFEELAALGAGGYLSDDECVELQQHTAVCVECRESQRDFTELARLGLPLTRSSLREFVDQVKTRPETGIRERFLQRARLEGVQLSRGVDRSPSHRNSRIGFGFAAAALASIVIVGILNRTHNSSLEASQAQVREQAQKQVDVLQQENNELKGRLSQMEQVSTSQKQEIQSLNAELENSSKSAENYRRNIEQLRAEAQQTATRNTQLLADFQNREKLLADARAELARMTETRTQDQTSAVAQQYRINQMSEQLRLAKADLDLERQLAKAGKDVRDLMGDRKSVV